MSDADGYDPSDTRTIMVLSVICLVFYFSLFASSFLQYSRTPVLVRSKITWLFVEICFVSTMISILGISYGGFRMLADIDKERVRD